MTDHARIVNPATGDTLHYKSYPADHPMGRLQRTQGEAIVGIETATAESYPKRDDYPEGDDGYMEFYDAGKAWGKAHVHQSVDGHPIEVGKRFWDNDLQVVEITQVADHGNTYPGGEIQTWHRHTRGSSDTMTGTMRPYGRLSRYDPTGRPGNTDHDANDYTPGTKYADVK